ncbi:DUF2867 domain-containing protein [Mycolicibacterium agri]|uniref:DUF2867 domain-containing protein n=1 Tax=Mycolicibacterium agri TaxID=36811 RepID=A0A7I9VTH1_MYCAG|nr:DUF2867 domain-containing protein [Mycolicibacterium agri]GFG48712.1 hypothetical protein MAGR_01530 [Mycolicibacterium agri]
MTTEEWDYADAFAVSIDETDTRSAKEVVLAGAAGVPWWMQLAVGLTHRFVLWLDLSNRSDPQHVLGWDVIAADHDRIQLRAAGPLVDGMLVGRRIPPSTAVLETFVAYRRPVLARMVWTAVAPVHRIVVPQLLRRAATSRADSKTPASLGNEITGGAS